MGHGIARRTDTDRAASRTPLGTPRSPGDVGPGRCTENSSDGASTGAVRCVTLARMGMEQIWPGLSPETRDWLIANNGDAIPADIAAEIDELVDAADAEDVWAVEPAAAPAVLEPEDEIQDADEDPGARYLAEDAIDWIEETANDE